MEEHVHLSFQNQKPSWPGMQEAFKRWVECITGAP